MEAEKRYKELRKEIEINLDLLKRKLDKHVKDFQSDKGNWGYVGDLSRINEYIRESLGRSLSKN